MTAEAFWISAALLGLAAGFLSGLMGIGGGLVIVPGLVLLCAVPQKAAQGISLAAIVPIAIMGVIRYRAGGNVPIDLRLAAILAAGGIIGAWAGVTLVHRLPPVLLRRGFAIFMIAVAVKMLFASDGDSDRHRARPDSQTLTD